MAKWSTIGAYSKRYSKLLCINIANAISPHDKDERGLNPSFFLLWEGGRWQSPLKEALSGTVL